MDLRLKGKTALVMGASRGLGSGIAASLAAEGCNLILVARNYSRILDHAKTLAKSSSIKATAIELDLNDPNSVRSLIEHIQNIGGVDILIGNVGGPPPSIALGNSPELWSTYFQSMVLSLIQIIDGVTPSMRKKKWGRILTITSSGVIQPIPTLALSNTLRASIVAFSKTLATEIAADGVTVNVVLPGRIDTERVNELDKSASQKQGLAPEIVRKNAAETIPMQRYGTVEEFANTCAFLVSDQAGYITGSSIRIDGGLIRSI